MEIIVRPANNGRYIASLDGRDLCNSRTPFFSAARALAKEGVPDETHLAMRHEGCSSPSFESTLKWARSHTVSENEKQGPYFTKYKEMLWTVIPDEPLA